MVAARRGGLLAVNCAVDQGPQCGKRWHLLQERRTHDGGSRGDRRNETTEADGGFWEVINSRDTSLGVKMFTLIFLIKPQTPPPRPLIWNFYRPAPGDLLAAGVTTHPQVRCCGSGAGHTRAAAYQASSDGGGLDADAV